MGSSTPPGRPPLPLGWLEPEHRALMEEVAQDVYELSVEDVYDSLRYWRERWERLQGWHIRWRRRRAQRTEAAAAHEAWCLRAAVLSNSADRLRAEQGLAPARTVTGMSLADAARAHEAFRRPIARPAK